LFWRIVWRTIRGYEPSSALEKAQGFRGSVGTVVVQMMLLSWYVKDRKYAVFLEEITGSFLRRMKKV
jgi:hypothetical protein